MKTKEQRKEIYLDVLDEFLDEEGNCICDSITSFVNKKYHNGIPEFYHWLVEENFPEFALFKPFQGEEKGVLLWWSRGDMDPRINALLFCIEMCEE